MTASDPTRATRTGSLPSSIEGTRKKVMSARESAKPASARRPRQRASRRVRAAKARASHSRDEDRSTAASV
jgi:hypothetical protein